MERKEGRGQPGAPRNNLEGASPKEQGRREKESTANNSPVSSVQQKSPDKLSPEPKSVKKGEKISVHNPGRTVFDCVGSKITLSPFDMLRTMVGDGFLHLPREEWPEHVREYEQEQLQEWRKDLKNSSSEELEDMLSRNKKSRDTYPKWSKKWEAPEKFLQALDQGDKEILEELRKRKGN